MRYLNNEKEIVNTINKIIRFSDPYPDKETIFIWPEGVFAGVYLEQLKKSSRMFKKNFLINI